MNSERARTDAILGCAEAEGREAAAQHIAFKTNMSVEDAKGMLAAAAKVGSAFDREEAGLRDTLALVRMAGVRGYRPAE